MTQQTKLPPTSGLQSRNVSERQSQKLNQTTDLVAEETAVAITYNGKTHAVMMASPINLSDFAIGFSLTEGIIDTAADIAKLEVREVKQGITVEIAIPPKLAKRLQDRQRSLTGRAGCGICGLTEIAAAIPKLEPLQVRAAPEHKAVDVAARALSEQQVLQQACGGIHGAALCNRYGEILMMREDVGRHNALDKLIGAAVSVKPDAPFAPDDFILMSSRASHELINKCVVAGVSSLVTLSAATSLAIDVAQRTNLNLVGFVRGDRQLVYAENEL